jgi:8-oxo-dGTP pyrophosphatase MutT (NUDIX family)
MTQIKGYYRKDGTFVPDHQDSRHSFVEKLKFWKPKHKAPESDPDEHASLFGHLENKGSLKDWKPKEKEPYYPNAIKHPSPKEDGSLHQINNPSTPSDEATWTDPAAIATFTPGGAVPAELNGIALAPWDDAPTTPEDWDQVDGQDGYLIEPEFEFEKGQQPAAGVVIEEPDGRIWVIHPTNTFGGYKGTFPKGRVEEDVNLQASAIKEAYEECGLKVEITGFLKDVDRSVTRCRYYTARRVGGTPAAMGWESQAVSLVPRDKLYEVLNNHVDHPMAESLGAGPQPPKPEPKVYPKPSGSNWSGGSGGGWGGGEKKWSGESNLPAWPGLEKKQGQPKPSTPKPELPKSTQPSLPGLEQGAPILLKKKA